MIQQKESKLTDVNTIKLTGHEQAAIADVLWHVSQNLIDKPDCKHIVLTKWDTAGIKLRLQLDNLKLSDLYNKVLGKDGE